LRCLRHQFFVKHIVSWLNVLAIFIAVYLGHVYEEQHMTFVCHADDSIFRHACTTRCTCFLISWLSCEVKSRLRANLYEYSKLLEFFVRKLLYLCRPVWNDSWCSWSLYAVCCDVPRELLESDQWTVTGLCWGLCEACMCQNLCVCVCVCMLLRDK
jgi:hypothetical protein